MRLCVPCIDSPVTTARAMTPTAPRRASVAAAPGLALAVLGAIARVRLVSRVSLRTTGSLSVALTLAERRRPAAAARLRGHALLAVVAVAGQRQGLSYREVRSRVGSESAATQMTAAQPRPRRPHRDVTPRSAGDPRAIRGKIRRRARPRQSSWHCLAQPAVSWELSASAARAARAAAHRIARLGGPARG